MGASCYSLVIQSPGTTSLDRDKIYLLQFTTWFYKFAFFNSQHIAPTNVPPLKGQSHEKFGEMMVWGGLSLCHN
jgi:hypothetical protein